MILYNSFGKLYWKNLKNNTMLSTLREGPGITNKAFYILCGILMLFVVFIFIHETFYKDQRITQCYNGYMYKVDEAGVMWIIVEREGPRSCKEK